MLWIDGNARNRANLHTLWRIEMAYAFGALMRVDDIVQLAHRNGIVGAFRLAHIAIDALTGDGQGHGLTPACAVFAVLAVGPG